jgi:hypothetical protein
MGGFFQDAAGGLAYGSVDDFDDVPGRQHRDVALNLPGVEKNAAQVMDLLMVADWWTT